MPEPSSAKPIAIAGRSVSWVTAIGICFGAATLHFGGEVFLPLAIATLVAFALSPLVSALRRRGISRILAVLISATLAFSAVGLVLAVMAAQVSLVVESLPAYQSNIIGKLDDWTPKEGSPNVLGRFVDMITRINDEIGGALSQGAVGASEGAGSGTPVAVAVVEDRNVWQLLQDILFPIISPIATAGLTIVVVIFMLLEREQLRDRFIRLTGANDLHRTTEMLEDAGARVASYLLIQILVNVIYAVPIGLGLWLIGVPNPTLWALMTLFLRFVPYIGPIIAAALPLFLAFAASPDWSMVLWTAALFAVVELITSNIVEPRLYGSRTGLSPLAVIVAAIVWTWIWGPMGLILSTPLTVCLVVLGRYLPQFEVFDILFGDDPMLASHARLYQRLLTGEVVESASQAEEALESAYLADYHQEVTLPALLLAQGDYDRGVLTQAQEERIAISAAELVEALDPVIAEELAEAATENEPLPGKGTFIMVSGGRSRLDDVAARAFGQALAAEGAKVTAVPRSGLMAMTVIGAEAERPNCLVLSFLDPKPSRASLLIVRRIKRAIPGLRVGVVIWQTPTVLADAADAQQDQPDPASAQALREAEDIGADFAVATMEAAMAVAFVDEVAKPLKSSRSRPPRRATRAGALAKAAN